MPFLLMPISAKHIFADLTSERLTSVGLTFIEPISEGSIFYWLFSIAPISAKQTSAMQTLLNAILFRPTFWMQTFWMQTSLVLISAGQTSLVLISAGQTSLVLIS